MNIDLYGADYVALLVFVVCWMGTDWLIAHRSARHPGVHDLIRPVRSAWMREAQRRDIRIADAGLIGHLIHSATFFSSTTALILGGLLALLGTALKSVEAVKNLPFAIEASQQALEIKVLVAILVFVVAFFRFTWSLRQFNLVTIYMGAMPNPARSDPVTDRATTVAGRLMSLAGENFIKGLRCYYFAIPVVCWLAQPWFFVAASVVVAGVIYWMDFHSRTLEAMRVGDESGSPTGD